MHPIAVLSCKTPEGLMTGLTFIGESESFCPPFGSYENPCPTSASILELPRDKKASKFLFQFNENGWCGLKIHYYNSDFIVDLGTKFSTEDELNLDEKEEIFAMKMELKDNYV